MDPTHATPPPSGSFLTPLLISLAGVVASSLAIVAYHMLLVKYCMRRRQRNGGDVSVLTDHHLDIALANGVDRKILETIPILSFSREEVRRLGTTDQTECVVCLAELEEGDTVRMLPTCRHVFHILCIDNWFQAHSSCPVCRTRVSVTTGSGSNPTSPPAPGDHENYGGERNIIIIQDSTQRQSHGQDNHREQETSTSGVRPKASLRHCVSLVFPRETKPKHLIMGLKRSLSMDQFYVLINLADGEDNGKAAASSFSSMSKMSTSTIMSNNSCQAQSMKHLDRMSSIMRSLSQLRFEGRSNSYGILPY